MALCLRPSPPAQTLRHCRQLIALGALLLATLRTGDAGAVLICGTPGGAGPGTPTGVINDYWAGSGSPGSGSASVTLGARRAGGAGNSIVAGDLILIIQMQDADVDSTNTANYGGNAGTGSGATAINRAGLYEYVLATNTVGAGGGALTFTPALTNSYRTRAYTAGSNGQSTWQAVRVPQYSTATATGVTAPAWNGTSGAIVAMDVENALTLSGVTAVNVAGLGFRGGLGRTLAGGAGANTDYRTLATVTTNAGKGEGIAGTPRYLNNTTAYNAAPVVLDTAIEGYPNGSYARGAPGNAGGGGTDGNAAANDQNTGGGGGSNYGFGGQGGNSWNSNLAVGGKGGAPFSAFVAPNRVFLGGGGGAGTTNNGTSDAATYSAPPGVSCTAAGGNCSSGAAGGGIVLIRAGSISGGGLVDARGSDAYNVANDGGGGGGAGGTVVLQSYFGGSASVNVAGGNGGNAWRSRNTLIDRHGPGGGGGGGFIAYSPSTGFAVTANYNAGLSGLSANNDPFGSTSGNGGFQTFDLPNVPGVQPGTFCPPAIKAATLAVDNGVAGAVDPGDTIEYTVVYRNGSSGAISGFNITDTLPAGVSYVPGSLTVTPSGGAAASANGAYNGGAATSLLAANISLPAGGIITAKLRGTASAPVCSNVFNQANSVQNIGNDVLGLTDNADSTQNEGGLPSGSYITQTPYGTAGASDRTGFTMGCPNLSTSTKSWVDLNGGDQEPGDVLRYTVTVIDSGGGPVTGVTVTDDIPANVNSFTVVSFPGGAVNSSTGAGTGANLNGFLNITGITVPAAGSVTIVFDVTINNGTLAGTTIANTATVTNPLGPGGTPPAPPITVSVSSVPMSGTKQLYFQPPTVAGGLAGPMQRTVYTGAPNPATNRYRLNTINPAVLTLSPALQTPLNLNANYRVVLQMLLNNTQNRTISFTLTLRYRLGASTVVLDTRTVSQLMTNAVLQTYPFAYAMPAVSIPQGAVLELLVANNNYSNRDVWLYPYNSTAADSSRLEVNCATVINVDAIDLFSDIAYPGGVSVASVAPGGVVRIRATVSDPFGSYDISAAAITLSNPSGTVMAGPAAMTQVADSGAATKIYEYRYTVPGGGPTGNWLIRVEASEGAEGTISDYKNAALPVVTPLPNLTFLKSSQVYSDPINGTTGPRAIPGAAMRYTLLATNFGAGIADANSLIFVDPLPSGTALFVGNLGQGKPVFFTDGAVASGFVAANVADSYSSKADCTAYGYTPVPDADGYDANICRLRVQMNGTFNGASGGSNPSFSLMFQVRVE